MRRTRPSAAQTTRRRLRAHDAQQRERERKVQRNRRAPFPARLNAHSTSKALNHALDDIHTNAAAGHVCRRGASAETRLEDEIEQALLGPRVNLCCGRNAPVDGGGTQHLRIDAAAVILDADEDAIPLLLGRQHERSLLCRHARGGGVSCMVGGVRINRDQRIGERDVISCLAGLAAANVSSIPAKGPSEVAHGTRKGVEHEPRAAW